MSLNARDADNLAQIEYHNSWTKGVKGIFYRLTSDAVAREIKASRGRILDVGCGDGLLLRNCSGSIVSIDLSLIHLQRAEVKDKVCADALQLPFSSKSFDLVILHAILEHLADPREALRETHRILKPNGRAVILVPNDFWLSVGRVLLGMWPPRHPDHRHWMSPRVIRNLTDNFNIIHSYPLPFRSLPFAINLYYFAVLSPR